jgi:hypothetical protein
LKWPNLVDPKEATALPIVINNQNAFFTPLHRSFELVVAVVAAVSLLLL